MRKWETYGDMFIPSVQFFSSYFDLLQGSTYWFYWFFHFLMVDTCLNWYVEMDLSTLDFYLYYVQVLKPTNLEKKINILISSFTVKLTWGPLSFSTFLFG